jgi:hypothetical protein
MEDLKLVDKTEKERQNLVTRVKIFSDTYIRNLGFMVVQTSYSTRKVIHSRNLILDISRKIQQLDQIKT